MGVATSIDSVLVVGEGTGGEYPRNERASRKKSIGVPTSILSDELPDILTDVR
ncbi:hypothetical protein [Mesorhizobium cantuariense]|uniref:Uncharacterized protein n=1 Tax=Mesorhizobium cantuariense TaxID=1300275 RepID=A0ABV7MNV3_9HYPH